MEILKKKKFALKFTLNFRFLSGVLLVVILFNIFAGKFLPHELFSAYASDIDANELVALANSERIARGLPPLTIDTRLVSAAEAKSNNMLLLDYWSHYAPDGTSPWDFIEAAHYDYTFAGENLARDFTSTVPIHNAWMNSPSHRDNILNPNFTNIGIVALSGEFQGKETVLVVEMFGKPRVPNSSYIVPTETTENSTQLENSTDTPVIDEPKDGTILNNALFDVKGTSPLGRTLEIFDNEKSIGVTAITDSQFDFTPTNRFSEGNHLLYAKALSEDNSESSSSNTVLVTIDTISPEVVSDSLHLAYKEYSKDPTKYNLAVTVLDNPISVMGYYDGSTIDFTKTGSEWIGTLTDISKGDLRLVAVDAAGNTSEATVTKESLGKALGEVNGTDTSISYSLRKWFLSDIGSRIFSGSLQGQINLAIILVMILLVVLDRIFLAKTGLTSNKSNVILHLPVFIALMFIALLGTGGKIL